MFDSAETVEDVPLDKIQTPNRDEKLHPPENEDQEDWEEFKSSVGTEPIQLPLAKRNGDGFEIIVGDRRTRAVEENGAETLDIRVIDEDISRNDVFVTRVAENYHRSDSDPRTKAWYAAQLSAPSLLLPGERDPDIEVMSQTEVADIMDVSDASVSNWLDRLRDENPLRAVLRKKTVKKRASEDEIETIDNIVELLKSQKDHKVIATGEEGFVADRLKDLEGVSLGEIELMAEKAVENGLNAGKFLEEVKDTYAADETSGSSPGSMSSGPLGGEDPFADNSSGRSFDDGVDAGPEGEREDESETVPGYDFDDPNISVDLDGVLPNDEMFTKDEVTTRNVKGRKIQDVSMEDEAAVLLNALIELSRRPNETDDEALRRVQRNFLQPVLIEEATYEIEAIVADMDDKTERDEEAEATAD